MGIAWTDVVVRGSRHARCWVSANFSLRLRRGAGGGWRGSTSLDRRTATKSESGTVRELLSGPHARRVWDRSVWRPPVDNDQPSAGIDAGGFDRTRLLGMDGAGGAEEPGRLDGSP